MRSGRFSLFLLVLSLGVGIANASTFSFAGTFGQDDQLQIFLFTAPTANTLVRTWSYAGGTNGSGQVIAAGGFDPILSVFDASGGLVGSSLLLATNDNGDACPTNAPNCVNTDPVTASAFDSLMLLGGLNPGGVYALVLSQADNAPNGPNFGGGFTQMGQGNFTATEFPCGGSGFCDANLAQRNGNWAVDISGVGSASLPGSGVPEPGSMLMLLSGAAGLAILRRRRKQI